MKHVLDFIVVGAQRSGTTSLFAYLREHPEIVVPAGKEVPYFTHARHQVSWEEYMRSLFAGADPGKRWGTVTPQYMVGGLTGPVPDTIADPGNPRNVPERIRERCPDARLIAILRDPIERACSHHDWACEVGWERRPFDQAIAEMLRPRALASARARPAERTGYISWGEYGRILAGYFEVFPREQLLAIYTAELKQDPAEVMRRVFEFVGVADDYVPPNLGAVYRATAAAPRRSPALKRALDSAQAATGRTALGRRLYVDRLLVKAAYRVDTWNRVYPRNAFAHVQATPREARGPSAATRAALREHYEQDGLLLASLLALATNLDPAPVGLAADGAPGVLEALESTWQRARQHLDARLPDRWAFWSLVSGGLALAPHTSPPLPDGRVVRLMAGSP